MYGFATGYPRVDDERLLEPPEPLLEPPDDEPPEEDVDDFRAASSRAFRSRSARALRAISAISASIRSRSASSAAYCAASSARARSAACTADDRWPISPSTAALAARACPSISAAWAVASRAAASS